MKDLILVVDDDRSTVEMLGIMLEAQGYEVLGAQDAARAMELLCSNRVSLVISDIKMPRMDGIEFLSRVKASFPDTEVIMMTAFVSVESAIEAMRRGAEITIRGESGRGTKTTDVFSLKGVSQALDRSAQECR